MEKTSFVIEGDVTTKVVENRQKKSDGTEIVSQTRVSVKTDDWFEGIRKELISSRYVIPAMPLGSRIAAMAEKNDRSVYVVEMTPTVRSLKFSYNKNTSEERLYKISFPFVILVQYFAGENMNGSPFIFYRNEPIFGEGDVLLKPNLPNIKNDYSVCWGNSSATKTSQPVNVKLASICQTFWQSQFNKDLMSNFYDNNSRLDGHPKAENGGHFVEWEKMTAQDPSFILKIKWPESGKKISDVLREGVGS